jgi:hypothetical protein
VASAPRNESVSRDNFVERMQVITLLVDQEFGVTDYVDEKDLSDLKLNLLLNLCRHDGEFYSVASEGSTSFKGSRAILGAGLAF